MTPVSKRDPLRPGFLPSKFGQKCRCPSFTPSKRQRPNFIFHTQFSDVLSVIVTSRKQRELAALVDLGLAEGIRFDIIKSITRFSQGGLFSSH